MNSSTKIERNSLFQLLKRGVMFLLFVFVLTCTLTAAFSEIPPGATVSYFAGHNSYRADFKSLPATENNLSPEESNAPMAPFWLLENQHSVRAICARNNNSNKRNLDHMSALLPDNDLALNVLNEENCNSWGPENRSLSICLHTAPVRAGPNADILRS